jgi:predicted PurR-regulated permease PerM
MSRPHPKPAGTYVPPRAELSLGERVVRATQWLMLLVGIAAIAWLLRFLAVPLGLALVLSAVLGPGIDRAEDKGISRKMATIACFVVLLTGIASLGAGVWPSLESWLQQKPGANETSVFEMQLTARLDGWQHWLESRYPNVAWVKQFEMLRSLLQAQRKALMEGLPTVALGAVSQLGSVALGLVVTFFVLIEGAAMKRAVVALVPNRHFENALVIWHRVDRQIASYLLGTALESALVTVILAFALWAVGMPNALLFAVLFGVANVIPFAGPFIGAAAGLLFALLEPTAPGLGMLIGVYVVVHFIDAMLINPYVMGKSLDMHPLTIIVGIAVGGTLGGVLGMLLVIPLLAVAKAIVTTVAEGVRNAATG